MKTHFYIYISILFIVMFSACGKKTDREYLSEVLENMNKVNSVKYHCVIKAWEPGAINLFTMNRGKYTSM